MSRSKPRHAAHATLLTVCLATVALILAACSGASPSASHKGQSIHLIEHPTNTNSVSVGSLTQCSDPTSCRGDYLLGDNPVFDAATNKQAGTTTFECFFFDPGKLLLHCPGVTITLTNRGQIVYNAIVDLGGDIRLANGTVVGGTGEFLGATGTVTGKKVGGNSDIVITLAD
jgi:hypothetical protein